MSLTEETQSVLILDDSPDLVEHYREILSRKGNFRVVTAIDGHSAKSIADRQLFDYIVIDAKLDYKGFEFGGIRLADDLRPRYGTGSILLISRFITKELLTNYGASYEFLEKYSGSTTDSFCAELVRRMGIMKQRQFAFVAMPFAKEYSDLYRDCIKPGVERSGFKCVRIDEIQHTRAIQHLIFEHVFSAKFVVLLADGQNPNAYYEAGFADAMSKEVVIVSKDSSSLPFDISSRCSIFYREAPQSLLSLIPEKLEGIRLRSLLIT